MRYPAIAYELVTDDGFDADGYLLANPDVAAWAKAAGDARLHYDRHGRDEGRRQVPRAFREAAAARRAEKYRRFATVLDPARGAGGGFRFLDRDGAFPVGYGERPHAVSDYAIESAHGGLGQFEDEVSAHPDRLYLDVGCGVRETLQQNCLYLEVYPSRTADVVIEPACTYPIATASLDGIGCFAVLEHVTAPWIAAAEFRRMLKPGGLLFVDWPFLQPVHGFPSHYYNATAAGLRLMFEDGFETLSLDTRGNQTPDRALTWLLRGWLDGIADEGARAAMLGMTVADLIAEPPRSAFWRRMLAATGNEARTGFACGNTLVARRRAE